MLLGHRSDLGRSDRDIPLLLRLAGALRSAPRRPSPGGARWRPHGSASRAPPSSSRDGVARGAGGPISGDVAAPPARLRASSATTGRWQPRVRRDDDPVGGRRSHATDVSDRVRDFWDGRRHARPSGPGAADYDPLARAAVVTSTKSSSSTADARHRTAAARRVVRTLAKFGMAINREITVNGESKEETIARRPHGVGPADQVLNRCVKRAANCSLPGPSAVLDVGEPEGGKRSKLKVVVENFQFVGWPQQWRRHGRRAAAVASAAAAAAVAAATKTGSAGKTTVVVVVAVRKARSTTATSRSDRAAPSARGLVRTTAALRMAAAIRIRGARPRCRPQRRFGSKGPCGRLRSRSPFASTTSACCPSAALSASCQPELPTVRWKIAGRPACCRQWSQ